MLTSQRKALISARLGRDGEIVAKTLAAELDLSEDTIRRDLRDMAAEGMLKRVHGGALPLSPALPDFRTRQGLAVDEKAALAARAVQMIEQGHVVFLDGGTTTAALAWALPPSLAITVVTHSPTIACAFEHHPAIEVILIGGRLYKHSMVATGARALDAIRSLRADLYFMGVTAAHPVHGLTTGDREEADTKRAISENAAATWVMLTAEKLGRASPFRIAPFTAATGLIVPGGLDPAAIAPYREQDVEIVEA